MNIRENIYKKKKKLIYFIISNNYQKPTKFFKGKNLRFCGIR